MPRLLVSIFMEPVHHGRSHNNNFKVTASILSALIAVLICAIYSICRIGFPHYGVMPLVKTVSLAFFLLFFPHTFWLFGRRTQRLWLFTEAAMSLWGIMAISLAGLGTAYLGLEIGPIFYSLGFVLLGAVLTKWLISQPSGLLPGSFLRGFLVAFTIAAASFFLVFQDPLINELIITGLAHRDTLNHASVISMIETYGIPSTGLDGIPYHPYHNGADWILAQVSSLTHIPVLQAVTMAYLVLFVPTFINTMLFFVADRKSRFTEDAGSGVSKPGWFFWVVLLAIFVGLMPGDSGIVASVSYIPGLCLVFIFLSLCILLADDVKSGTDKMSLSDRVLVVLVFPLLLAGIGFTKVSLLWLLAAAYGYLFLRLGLYRNRTFVISFALTIVSSIFTLKLAVYPADAAVKMAPLYMLNWYPHWWPFYLVTEFAWSWLFIILALYHRRVTSFGALRDAVRKRSVLDVETLVVICLAGAGPALMLGISDASGGYFVDFQRWFSGALLLANLDAFRNDFVARDEFSAQGELGNRRLGLRHVLVVCVAAIFLAAALHSFLVTAARTFLAGQIRTRMALRTDSATALAFTRTLSASSVGEIGKRLGPAFKALFASVDDSAWSAANLKNRKTLDALQDLSKLPLSQKEETLLYIPRSNRLFWDLPASVCLARPFVAPAVTGIAMIDGLPGPDCAAGGGRYGYEVYKGSGKPESRGDETEANLCRRARGQGFSRIIFFQSDSGEHLSVRATDCGAIGGKK